MAPKWENVGFIIDRKKTSWERWGALFAHVMMYQINEKHVIFEAQRPLLPNGEFDYDAI